MSDTLEQIVEEAWRLVDVAHPGSHQACKTCCMSAGHNHEFLAVPARELSLDFLNGWFLSAYYGPASPGLARYLLPRLMQATVRGEDLVYGLEMALSRLRTGDGDFWTDAESDLITRFRRAFLEAMRGALRDGMLDDSLCMFIMDGHDAPQILADVWAWSDGDLIDRLHHDWCGLRHPRIYQTSFWDDAGRIPVYAWYTGQPMQDRILGVCVDDDAPFDLREKAGRLLNCIAAG